MPERVSSCSGVMPLSGETSFTQQKRAPNPSSLFRSQSINSFPPDVEEFRRSSPKISSSRKLSIERIPITHFCTPRRRSSNLNMSHRSSTGTARRLIDPPSSLSSRASTPLAQPLPLQRHHSEASLLPPPATPNGLCISSSQFATPDYYSRVRMETPTPRKRPTHDVSVEGEESSNLTVGVRVRPLNPRETTDSNITSVVRVIGNEVQVTCDAGTGTTHTFCYDHCFASGDPNSPNYASQESVFSTMVQPLVDKAFQGYNACLFAYGQTGSGKSYSMMGTDTDCNSGLMCSEAGIIPRFCHELFERISSLDDSQVKQQVASDVDLAQVQPIATIEISYFEIYNEKIHDLLGMASSSSGVGSLDANGRRPPLKVREHPQYGPYVVDLSVHGVESYKDVQGWLAVGNGLRATAATGMNEKSSRSHSIFSVILTQTHPHGDVGLSRRSKINLVDLAGSERLSQTCASGDRLREGVSINRSLLTLGKVIAALADSAGGRKRGFVPYRDSVLTWLLRESLGGNSSTTMLATVSPCSTHMEETLATLRYACQARTIVNRVRVNEDPSHRRIRQLLAEIAALREVHEDLERRQQQRQGGGSATSTPTKGSGTQGALGSRARCMSPAAAAIPVQDEAAVQELRERLRHTEEQLAAAQKSWSERLREAERCKHAEMSLLRRRGVALALDGQQLREQPCPFLVNLTPDPSLSGALLYLLPPGPVRVGRLDGEVGSGAITAARLGSPLPGHAQSPAHSPAKGRSPPHIQLEGPLVHKHHCTIENRNGVLTLEPGREGLTYVNGRAVTGRTVLRHGDRLVLGGNHYFRVSNPHDKLASSNNNEKPADYEFAHSEILAVQEAKLKAQLEEAKQKAMVELEEVRRETEARLMSQRTDYEKQLQLLGQSLEQHKDALLQERRQKHQLEVQKSALEAEMTRQQLQNMKTSSPTTSVEASPHHSKFIEELEALLNGSMTALENDTTCTSPGNSTSFSDRSPYNSTSLHEMHVQVREASQRCKELSIPFDFQQQHVVQDSRLEPVVRVRDKSQKMSALWSLDKFYAWLNRLRDWDPEDSIAELMMGVNCGDDADLWEPDEDSQLAEEMDGSICVNTLPIRRKLNESFQNSFTDSPMNSPLNFPSLGIVGSTKAKQYIAELESAASELHSLLSHRKGFEAPLCLVSGVQDNLSQLRKILLKESKHHRENPEGPSTPQLEKCVRFFPGFVRA